MGQLCRYSHLAVLPAGLQFSLEISLWSSAYGLLIALVGSYSLRQLGQTRFHDFVMSFTNMTSNSPGCRWRSPSSSCWG